MLRYGSDQNGFTFVFLMYSESLREKKIKLLFHGNHEPVLTF